MSHAPALAWCAATLVVAWAPSAPAFQNGSLVDDGSVAAANRWPLRDGSPARTGASATRALRRPPQVLWERRFGTLEGEPLVWDQRVVVCERLGAEQRALYVLDLESGRLVFPPLAFRTPLPLEPCLWERGVVVRAGPGLLRSYWFGYTSTFVDWERELDAPLSGPVVFGELVHVRAGDALECLELYEGGRSLWRRDGRFRGSPSVRAGELFALEYDGRGRISLGRHNRTDGNLLSRSSVGQHFGGKVPPATADVRITVAGDMLLVHHAQPLAISSAAVNTSLVWWPPGASAPEEEGAHLPLLGRPAYGAGWLYAHDDSGGETFGRFRGNRDGDLTGSVLATAGSHPEFLDPPRAPTVVGTEGDVVLTGSSAFSAEEGDILWRLPFQPTERLVPARGRLLTVREGRTLVCLGEPGLPGEPFGILADAVDSTRSLEVLSGRAVFRDGSLLEGGFELRLADGVIDNPWRPEENWPRKLEQLALVEDSTGRLVWAGEPGDARSALELLLGKELGVPSSKREAERLEGLAADLLWKRAEALRLEGPRELLILLLEMILARNPDHPRAAETVLELIPRRLWPEGSYDPTDWLEFARALERIPVRVVQGRSGESAKRVERARERWRADLIALESENLLIVTPVARPGAIARCLTFGELVCDTLAELFPAEETNQAPLLLQLFATRRDYLENSPGKVENTLGHYSRSEDLTRIFLPSGEEEFERILPTYAHEITHHWLDRAAERTGSRSRASGRGYWIVEGVAELVEGFHFEVAAATWESENPRASYLDVVANAEPEELLDWERLYRMDQDELWQLSPDPHLEVRRSWSLGRLSVVSERSLFYNQAGATCHWMYHAEGGRHRAALKQLVLEYYTERRPARITELVDLSGEEIGERVRAHARGVIAEAQAQRR